MARTAKSQWCPYRLPCPIRAPKSDSYAADGDERCSRRSQHHLRVIQFKLVTQCAFCHQLHANKDII